MWVVVPLAAEAAVRVALAGVDLEIFRITLMALLVVPTEAVAAALILQVGTAALTEGVTVVLAQCV